MDFLGQLKKKLHGVEAQVNPFDHNQTYSTVVNNQPVPTPKPAANAGPAPVPTPSFAPPKQPSFLQQLHNKINGFGDAAQNDIKSASDVLHRATGGTANFGKGVAKAAPKFVEDSFVKPVTNTFAAPVELGRSVVGMATHNPAAELAAANRAEQDVRGSLPVQLVSGVYHFGKAASYVPSVVNDEIHNRPIQNGAAQKGLSALNQSYLGGALTGAEDIIAHNIKGASEDAKAAGFDPNQSVAAATAKTAVGVGNALAPLYGLEHGDFMGVNAAVDAGKAMSRAAKNTVLNAASHSKPVVNISADRLTSYEGAPDRAAVDAYKQKIAAGKDVGPVIAMRDSKGSLGIEDGKHRFQAYRELGIKNIPTKIMVPADLQRISQGGYAQIPGAGDAMPKVSQESAPTDIPTSSPDASAPQSPADQTISSANNTADRPYAEVQKAIEDAHNSGNDKLAAQIIDEQVPEDDRAAMRSALGIKSMQPEHLNQHASAILQSIERHRETGTPAFDVRSAMTQRGQSGTGMGEPVAPNTAMSDAEWQAIMQKAPVLTMRDIERLQAEDTIPAPSTAKERLQQADADTYKLLQNRGSHRSAVANYVEHYDMTKKQAQHRVDIVQREINLHNSSPNPMADKVTIPHAEEGDIQTPFLNAAAIDQEVKDRANLVLEMAKGLDKHDIELLNQLRGGSPENVAIAAHNPELLTQVAEAAKTYNDFTHAVGYKLGQNIPYRQRYGARIFGTDQKIVNRDQMKIGEPTDKGYTMPRSSTSSDQFLQSIALDAKERASDLRRLAIKQGLEEAFPGKVAVGEIPRDAETGIPYRQLKKNQELSLPQDIADKINRRTGVDQSHGFLRVYDKANAGLKYAKLGGGTFHMLTEAMNFLGQQLASGKLLTDAAASGRAIESTFSKSAFERHLAHYRDNGTLQKARFSGITLRPDEILGDVSIPALERLNNANPIKMVHEAVFAREIPMQKLAIFDQATEHLDFTKPADRAEMRATADAVNHIFGGLNRVTDTHVLTPGAAKTASRFLLATDFTEAKINTVRDALTEAGPKGNIARQAVIGKTLIAAVPGLIALTAQGKLNWNNPQDVTKALIDQALDPQVALPIKNDKGVSKIAKTPETFVSEFGRLITPLFADGPDKAQAEKDALQHYGAARLSAGLSEIEQLATNKDYQGQDIIARDENGKIDPRKTAINIANQNAPIPIAQGVKVGQHQETLAEGVLNTVGFRTKNDPNDPQTRNTQDYFDTQGQLLKWLKNGELSKIDPSMHDVSPAQAKQYVDAYNAKHPAGSTDPNTGMAYPRDWNARSGQAKADAYLNNDGKNGMEQFSPSFYIDRLLAQRDSNRPHDPVFDLKGNGTGVDGNAAPKAEIALQYGAMVTGDPQKSVIEAANGGKNGWLAQYESTAGDYQKNYKQSMTNYMASQGWTQPAIKKYWDNHPENNAPITPPEFDKATNDLMDQYDKITDPTEKAQFFSANAAKLGGAFDSMAQYVNAKRTAEGNLQLQGYPEESNHVKQILDNMPQGTDKDSKKARAQIIDGNPDVSNYLANIGVYNVTKGLSGYLYKNPANMDQTISEHLNDSSTGSQKILKGISNLGNYDIYKDPNTGMYSLDPVAAGAAKDAYYSGRSKRARGSVKPRSMGSLAGVRKLVSSSQRVVHKSYKVSATGQSNKVAQIKPQNYAHQHANRVAALKTLIHRAA